MSVQLKKRHYTLLNQRQLDIIHVPLWIIKDTCWMMEFKALGVLMIIPTISVAIILCYKSRNYLQRLLLNGSVLCWVSANALWMLNDFFDLNIHWLSLMLFSLGLIVVAIYVYFRIRRHKTL